MHIILWNIRSTHKIPYVFGSLTFEVCSAAKWIVFRSKKVYKTHKALYSCLKIEGIIIAIYVDNLVI